jgi:hypothetical protein
MVDTQASLNRLGRTSTTILTNSNLFNLAVCYMSYTSVSLCFIFETRVVTGWTRLGRSDTLHLSFIYIITTWRFVFVMGCLHYVQSR